jgi:hypothetical protein
MRQVTRLVWLIWRCELVRFNRNLTRIIYSRKMPRASYDFFLDRITGFIKFTGYYAL